MFRMYIIAACYYKPMYHEYLFKLIELNCGIVIKDPEYVPRIGEHIYINGINVLVKSISYNYEQQTILVLYDIP